MNFNVTYEIGGVGSGIYMQKIPILGWVLNYRGEQCLCSQMEYWYWEKILKLLRNISKEAWEDAQEEFDKLKEREKERSEKGGNSHIWDNDPDYFKRAAGSSEWIKFCKELIGHDDVVGELRNKYLAGVNMGWCADLAPEIQASFH